MAYKQPSSGPFKMMGSSPAKQKGNNLKRIMTEKKVAAKKAGTFYNQNSATAGIPELEKLKAKRIAEYNAGKIIKFGEGSNIIAGKEDFAKAAKSKPTYPKNFNATGSSKAGKLAQWTEKGGKFLSNKALGVLGFMGAGTLSASATPTDNQKKNGSYTSNIQDIIPKKKEVKKTYPTRKFPTRKF